MNAQISLDQDKIYEISALPANFTDGLESRAVEEGPIKRGKKLTIPEGYYSEEEMAGFLCKTIATLRTDHCHRRNSIPPKTKLGRLIIYSKASFEAWLKSREIKHFERKARWETNKPRRVA